MVVRILLADDHAIVREARCTGLERDGMHRVKATADGTRTCCDALRRKVAAMIVGGGETNEEDGRIGEFPRERRIPDHFRDARARVLHDERPTGERLPRERAAVTRRQQVVRIVVDWPGTRRQPA